MIEDASTGYLYAYRLIFRQGLHLGDQHATDALIDDISARERACLEMLPGARRQSDPALREQRDFARDGTRPGDNPIHSHAHLFRCVAAQAYHPGRSASPTPDFWHG